MTARKKINQVSRVTIAAIVPIILVGCGSGTQSAEGHSESMAEMDPITLTAVEVDSEESVFGRSLGAFIEQVEDETDGKVQFELYASASLIPGEEMLNGIGDGVADIGRIISAYYPQELQTANWFGDLGAVRTASYPHGMLEGSFIGHETHIQDGPLLEELEQYNVTPLMNQAAGQGAHMICTAPVDSLDDAQGLRVRTAGEIWVDEVEALGMTPVSMPMLDVYEGLQRGTIDCVSTEVPSFISYGLWEVAPHYVPLNLSQTASHPLVINADTWDSLPDEVKDIIDEAAFDLFGEMMDNVIDEYAIFASEGPEDHGLVFHDTAELDEVLAAHQDERISDMIDTAPSSVENPQEFISNVESVNDHWSAITSEELSLDQAGLTPEEREQAYLDAANTNLQPLWDRFKTEATRYESQN